MGGGPPQMDASLADNEASTLGWILYATGWAMCCCCGPVGPIFWCAVPCIFFTKPKDVQRSHPRERAVAMINGVVRSVHVHRHHFHCALRRPLLRRLVSNRR